MAEVAAQFGGQLRSERERRRIPLEALCAETKVNPRHFAALEQGDYKALPGGVFRRGIVRSYLHALGLNDAEWMPRFQASHENYLRATGMGPEVPDEAWVEFALNVKKNRIRLDTRTRLRWLGVGALFLILLLSCWAVFHFMLRKI